MLDNVININYYSVDTSENSNLQHRLLDSDSWDSKILCICKAFLITRRNVEFADRSMELISYYAINASSDLAKRGSYKTYEGSLWSQGILPKDSIRILKEQRGEDYLKVDESEALDWETLRKKVLNQGMRNSNVMAIAPTATISNITGVTQSIEAYLSKSLCKIQLVRRIHHS